MGPTYHHRVSIERVAPVDSKGIINEAGIAGGFHVVWSRCGVGLRPIFSVSTVDRNGGCEKGREVLSPGAAGIRDNGEKTP